MSKVQLKPVKVFELLTTDGRSLGLFKQDSQWQGMRCLKALDGSGPNERESVVVDWPAGFSEAISEICGTPVEVVVVKASPDVAMEIRRGAPKVTS